MTTNTVTIATFTGPSDEESLSGPTAVLDPSIPDLICNVATGEVKLDVDGSNIIAYSLKNLTNAVSRSLGSLIVPLDLVVLSPAVPEPSTCVLAVFGVFALALYGCQCWRAKLRVSFEATS